MINCRFAVLFLAIAATVSTAEAAVIYQTYNPSDTSSVDSSTRQVIQYSGTGAAAPWNWQMQQLSITFTPSANATLDHVYVPLSFRHGSGSVTAFLDVGSSTHAPVNQNKASHLGGPELASTPVPITTLSTDGWETVGFDFGGVYELIADQAYTITLRTSQFHSGGAYWYSNDGTPNHASSTYLYGESATNHSVFTSTPLTWTPGILITSIPEPATAMLIGLLGLGLGIRRRR